MGQKKHWINFIVTLLVALILSQFLPWWSIMVAGFVTGLFFSLKKAAVFVVPFLAIFLFWSVYAYVVAAENDFILSKKVSELFSLGGNPFVLMLVTGVVGGLAAGLAAILGKQLSTLVNKS